METSPCGTPRPKRPTQIRTVRLLSVESWVDPNIIMILSVVRGWGVGVVGTFFFDNLCLKNDKRTRI